MQAEQHRWAPAHLLGGPVCAHNLQQRHHVGGAEEVRANDAVCSGAEPKARGHARTLHPSPKSTLPKPAAMCALTRIDPHSACSLTANCSSGNGPQPTWAGGLSAHEVDVDGGGVGGQDGVPANRGATHGSGNREQGKEAAGCPSGALAGQTVRTRAMQQAGIACMPGGWHTTWPAVATRTRAEQPIGAPGDRPPTLTCGTRAPGRQKCPV